MVNGESLRLPGEFLTSKNNAVDIADAPNFVKELRHQILQMQPGDGTRHGKKEHFVFKDLATTDQVFICHDGPKNCLQLPYGGLFSVVSRKTKTFVIEIRGKHVTVSIDGLKTTYVIKDDNLDEFTIGKR